MQRARRHADEGGKRGALWRVFCNCRNQRSSYHPSLLPFAHSPRDSPKRGNPVPALPATEADTGGLARRNAWRAAVSTALSCSYLGARRLAHMAASTMQSLRQ